MPGSGRSPGEENGYPLQYSHLENFIDRGAWWATFHGIAKSQACLTSEMCLDFIINLPEFKSLLEMLINIWPQERGHIAVVCVSLSFIVKIKMKMATSLGFCDDQRKHACGNIWYLRWGILLYYFRFLALISNKHSPPSMFPMYVS